MYSDLTLPVPSNDLEMEEERLRRVAAEEERQRRAEAERTRKEEVSPTCRA
eukprot:SAG31_NODE_30366_length_382_cov_0.777385_1_plen_51_part_00